MRLIGVEGYGRIIEHTIDMTFYLKSLVDREEELELGSIPEVSILCFRFVPKEIKELDIPPDKKENLLSDINIRLQKELEVSGKAFLSIATYQGKKVLRAVILNHCTQKEDLEFVINEVLDIGRRMVSEGLNL